MSTPTNKTTVMDQAIAYNLAQLRQQGMTSPKAAAHQHHGTAEDLAPGLSNFASYFQLRRLPGENLNLLGSNGITAGRNPVGGHKSPNNNIRSISDGLSGNRPHAVTDMGISVTGEFSSAPGPVTGKLPSASCPVTGKVSSAPVTGKRKREDTARPWYEDESDEDIEMLEVPVSDSEGEMTDSSDESDCDKEWEEGLPENYRPGPDDEYRPSKRFRYDFC